MTCICGVASKGEVFIGGDSAGVAGTCVTSRADAKVFRNGPFLIGFTASYRMGQLTRFSFQPPDHDDNLDTFEYMATAFVNSLRHCFRDGGFAKRENERESGGKMLVGYRGELFRIEEDYHVGIQMEGFAAIGTGAQVALGALHATQDIVPRERVRIALEAAARFCTEVRAPFVVQRLSAEVVSASL